MRGHESRWIRYQKQGRPLRRTGKASKGARVTKKLREKTSWFRQKSQEDCYPGGKKTTGTTTGKTKKTSEVPRKTCLFVEYTSKGELAKKLRDTIQKLEPILGFGIKVVEKTGLPITANFPSESWDGAPCGRLDCITCTQGAETVPPCTRQSMVYENVCLVCNEGAKSGKKVVQKNLEVPSIYVGESSRSIKERAEEHWQAFKNGNEGSHILKHQTLQHQNQEP